MIVMGMKKKMGKKWVDINKYRAGRKNSKDMKPKRILLLKLNRVSVLVQTSEID